MADNIQEIEVWFTTGPDKSLSVGTLAIQERRLYFEYSHDWLHQNLELSPFILPLKTGLIEHKKREFSPLFGLFDDSLPDGWGLLLMGHYFRNLGRDPLSFTPLDRLLYLGRCTMGALTYHPPTRRSNADDTILNLHELASLSQQIYAGDEVEVLPLLLRAGGSPGGARPKVLVGYNSHDRTIITGEDILPSGYCPWIIKFSELEDTRDAGPVEYAYSLMAGAAGIIMPETRLFITDEGDSFFGAKRFDRGPDNRRYHVHTFGNLIQSNFRIPSCDYGDLLKVTSILTRNRTNLLAACRLMLFNVLTHNRDDHVKNFSFILDDTTKQWSLSPAYDLTFSYGPGGEHSTTIAGERRAPAYSDFVKLGKQYDISKKELKNMIAEITDATERWPEFADNAGVSKTRTNEIAKHLRRQQG